MTPAQRLTRKYYLNRMVKRFAKVKAKQRMVMIDADLLAQLTQRQNNYLRELSTVYFYSTQQVIPQAK